MKPEDATGLAEAQPPLTNDQYYQHARPEIVALVPIDARRILDVGCGAGGLAIKLARRQQAEYDGIEPVTRAADIARGRMTRVWNCPVEEALEELPEGHYDCIVVADVFEHLLDPLNVLSRLRSKLAPGGHLVASVPNIQNWSVVAELLRGRWAYRNEGILDRTHLRFFTRSSFSEMFWDAGFRIQSVGQTRSDHRPPGRLVTALHDSGFSPSEVLRDSDAFQFLIDAVVPTPQPQPKITVVVLNWNGQADTIGCVQSLTQVDYVNFEIVVVDNGSTDGSVPAIRAAFPGVGLIETGHNLGYAGGNNAGIRWALERGTDYVFIINNDTVVDSGLLKAFVRATELAPEAGVYGAKIFQEDQTDRLWFAGAEWRPNELEFRHVGFNEPDSIEFNGFREWDYLTGCALFVDVAVFAKVGLLDEDFFLVYEETDWCFRARAQGYRCLFVPQARLWHKVSVSFGGEGSPLAMYFVTRNKLLWARKHLGAKDRAAVQRKAWRKVLPRFERSRDVSAFKSYYWAVTQWLRNARGNLADPTRRAMLYGLLDYHRGRLGDCPAYVRRLAARSRQQHDQQRLAERGQASGHA